MKSLDKFSEKRYTPQALRPAGCQWLCQRYIINIIRSVSVSVNTQIIVSSPLRYVSGEPKAKPKNIRSAKFHAKTGVIWRLLRKKTPRKKRFLKFLSKNFVDFQTKKALCAQGNAAGEHQRLRVWFDLGTMADR